MTIINEQKNKKGKEVGGCAAHQEPKTAGKSNTPTQIFPHPHPLYPPLRFPQFSDNWQEKKLGEVSGIKMGQSPDSKFYNNFKNGKVLIQGNADIIGRKIYPRIWTTAITKESKKDDLIMTVRAPVGHIAKSKFNSCIGRGVCSIRNNENSNNEFLYQFLLKFENKWIKYEQGSTFTAVNSKDVRNLKIKIPTKPEQEKIASFLGGVDNWLENLKGQKKELENYKKGIMQKIFPDNNQQDQKTPTLRFPQFSDNWQEKKLGELLNEIIDKTFKNNQYTILSSSKSGIYIQDEYFKKQTASKNNIGYKIIKKGQFTYRSMSDTGEFTFNLQNKINIGIVSPAYPVFETKNNILNSIFLYSYLNNACDIKKQILMSKQGGTRFALNYNKFNKFKINLPSLPEQEKIASFLTSIDDIIDSTEQKISEAEKWKKGLMQKMFV